MGKKIDFKNYLLVIFIILMSDDTLLFGTNMNQSFIVLKYVAYVLFIFLYFLNIKDGVLKKTFFKGLKIFSILLLLVVLSSLYNNDFMTGNFLMLLTLLTAIVGTNFINFEQFQKYFVNITYFLAVCSLVVYAVNIFVPLLLSFFPIIINFGEVPFRTVFLSNVFLGGNQFRNPGIFREPGVYAIYLNFALIFLLFFRENFSIKKVVLLALALLSTLSTAGIMVFFLIVLLYFFKERSFKIFFIAIGFGLIVCSIFLFFPAVYEGLFSKLNTSDKDYLSSLARLAAFLVPIEIVKENFLFGVGLTKFVYYYEQISLQLVGFVMKADSTSTNTFLNTFAIFGVFFGVLILKFYYNFCKIIDSKYAFLLLILIFVMFSSQDLRYSFIYLTFLSYGFIGDSKLARA